MAHWWWVRKSLTTFGLKTCWRQETIHLHYVQNYSDLLRRSLLCFSKRVICASNRSSLSHIACVISQNTFFLKHHNNRARSSLEDLRAEYSIFWTANSTRVQIGLVTTARMPQEDWPINKRRGPKEALAEEFQLTISSTNIPSAASI